MLAHLKSVSFLQHRQAVESEIFRSTDKLLKVKVFSNTWWSSCLKFSAAYSSQAVKKCQNTNPSIQLWIQHSESSSAPHQVIESKEEWDHFWRNVGGNSINLPPKHLHLKFKHGCLFKTNVPIFELAISRNKTTLNVRGRKTLSLASSILVHWFLVSNPL